MLLFGAAAWLCGCVGTATLPPQATFGTLVERYAAAWRADDVDGVMNLFTRDAVLMPHHGDTPVVGREAIRAHWFPGGTSGIDLQRYEFNVDDALSDGALGIAHGRFTIAFSMPRGANAAHYANAGNFMMVFRREGGGWKIARYIWNDPLPATP